MPLIQRFLDRDQRPGAIALTLSEADCKITPSATGGERIEFSGALGAIQGERTFVGFSGVDLSSGVIKNIGKRTTRDFNAGLRLAFESLRPASAFITVQIVVSVGGPADAPAPCKTYEADFQLKSAPFEKRLSFETFFLSFRGRQTKKVYDGSGSIERVRVFFKRSLNGPGETAQIPCSFALDAAKFELLGR